MSFKQGLLGFLVLMFMGGLLFAATEKTGSTPEQKAPIQDNLPKPEPVANVQEPPSQSNNKISVDPTLGQQKSQVCAACHGMDGNSVVPAWPKIAGQLEKYLVKELKEYRKGQQGARFDPVMYPMTQSLSDSDIDDLAAYFSKQTETIGSAKPELLALGEKIYRSGNLETGLPACAACHSPDGAGNGPAVFPRISGQFAEYTADQLKKFRAKTRSDDPNGIMRDIAKKMSDEEIQAVSSYVSGLH